MKIPKDAARTARQLIRATVKSGSIDTSFAQAVIAKLAKEKPRNYLATLTSYHRMLRLEAMQRHAVVESAGALSSAEQNDAFTGLKAKYGQDTTCEFRVNPELLGGMKIRIGSNVLDGSVKARLDALRENLGL